MPQNAASGQVLHCLCTGIPIQNTVKRKYSPGTPENRTELFQILRVDKSTGQKRRVCRISLLLHHSAVLDSKESVYYTHVLFEL